jgi:5-methylcytosine-specific restriction enzyme A
MPLRIQTRCRHPGCPRLTRERFCDQHRGTYSHTSDTRRGTAPQRGYDRAWSAVADARRQLDYGLCQPCRQEDYVTPARIVDHILPLHVRPDWRLVLGNTQVICAACHQQKTTEDNQRYGSSTQQQLTSEQMENRKRALELSEPSRGD